MLYSKIKNYTNIVCNVSALKKKRSANLYLSYGIEVQTEQKIGQKFRTPPRKVGRAMIIKKTIISNDLLHCDVHDKLTITQIIAKYYMQYIYINMKLCDHLNIA